MAGNNRLAVIRSGPAGLSCAHDLALMGYRVTVFEATDVPGGMLRHGIPEYRLPRTLIDKEIEKIRFLGVEPRYGSPLNETFGIDQLKKAGFEAIFISIGTQKGRDLNIEGSSLDGVVKAIDYLLNINIASLESFDEMPVLRSAQGHEEFEEEIPAAPWVFPHRPDRNVGATMKTVEPAAAPRARYRRSSLPRR